MLFIIPVLANSNFTCMAAHRETHAPRLFLDQPQVGVQGLAHIDFAHGNTQTQNVQLQTASSFLDITEM